MDIIEAYRVAFNKAADALTHYENMLADKKLDLVSHEEVLDAEEAWLDAKQDVIDRFHDLSQSIKALLRIDPNERV